VRYACVARHRGEFPLRLMCRVLEVSPSGYYVWRKRSPRVHALADELLMLNVRIAFKRSRRTYGAPRVHRDLRDEGIRVGKKRVARLMRQDGLRARQHRRHVRTTDSTHAHPIAPNLLERQFDVNGVVNGVAGPRELNRVWISDITYIPTREGFLYLAIVLDLASRRVVGWSMQDTLEAELALAALRMAIAQRGPAPGLLHHSDQGVQYACDAYRRLLTAYRMKASMSKKGDCWDNAVAESFFSTLELELIDTSDWKTRDEARRAVFEYIEAWYNRARRHSTLGYRSPAAYETEVRRAAA